MNTFVLLTGLLLPAADPPVPPPSDNARHELEVRELKEKLQKTEEALRRQKEQNQQLRKRMDEYLRERDKLAKELERRLEEFGNPEKPREEYLRNQLEKQREEQKRYDDRIPLPPGICDLGGAVSGSRSG